MKQWKEFALGLFILGAALLLAYMSITVGKVRFGETMIVEAIFENASGIVKDAPVMMAGIEVGHVESMEVKNQRAKMTLVINPEVQVFADARAEIRAKSLLGEKYIAIIPGSYESGQLQNGALIENTMTPVDLDEVLNHLAPVLTNLDPHDLNTIVHTLAMSFKGRENDLGEMISGASTLLKTVGNNKEEIERIIKNLDGTTAKANTLLARNGPAIEQMIGNLNAVSNDLRTEAPTLVRNLNDVSEDVKAFTDPLNGPVLARRIDTISAHAEEFTTSLNQHPDLVPNLNSTLSEIPPLLRKAPATLDRLPAVLDQLSPVLSGANKLLTDVEPVLKKVDNLLEEKKIRQILQEEGVNIHGDVMIKLW